MMAANPSLMRRWLIPGLFTLVSLAILISLGFWQLERKQWKEGLIATLDKQMSAPPVALPASSQWNALTQAGAEFRRVSLTGQFIDNAPPVYLYTGASALRTDVKQPGYFVFAPLKLSDGSTVVVNRGYVPMDRKHDTPSGTIAITGFIRFPEKPGWFVAERSTEGDVFFVRDPQAMATARGWGPVAPFYIDQEAPVPQGGVPRPGTLTVRLKNDHLGYALTWFGLAASLAVIFAIWAARNRYHKTAL